MTIHVQKTSESGQERSYVSALVAQSVKWPHHRSIEKDKFVIKSFQIL